ncbi:MAG: cytochrome c [Ignavibacteriaceae bacterium]|nr:cytochrome c [Ignavibacteriaceae bacterium]
MKNTKKRAIKILSINLALGVIIAITSFIYSGCSEEVASDTGIGPIKKIEIPATIDQNLVNKGKEIFEAKCTACHKFDEKFTGPPLSGVTKKRKPEWIMNMMLNPVEMTQKDPEAKRLYQEYLLQMTFQDVTEADARAILEYFRSKDQ